MIQKMKRLILIFCVLGASLKGRAVDRAPSVINSDKKFEHYKNFYFPKQVEEEKWTHEEMKKIFPWELPVDSSESKVFSSFADKSLQYWWNNSQIRNTSIGRAADEMQEKMKADLVLKEDQAGENKIQHKLSFQILAAQAIARIEYSGLIKAALRYHVTNSTSECEIVEKIDKNKQLVFRQINTVAESRAALLMSWDW